MKETLFASRAARAAANSIVVTTLLLGSFAFATETNKKTPFSPDIERVRKYEANNPRTRPKDDTLDPRFNPESGLMFGVPTRWVDASELDIIIIPSAMPADLQKTIFRKNGDRTEVLFAVHPAPSGLKFYENMGKVAQGQPGPNLPAYPTASSRTVFAKVGKTEVQVKLNLDEFMGANKRLMNQKEIVRSTYITGVLELMKKQGTLPKTYDYVPEFLGLVIKGEFFGGELYRGIYDKMKTGQYDVMPYFAFTTANPADGGVPPVIRMLQAIQKTKDPAYQNLKSLPEYEQLKQIVVTRYINEWLYLAIHEGVILGEDHGQNLNQAIDRKTGLPGPFVHKDFGGLDVIDIEFRQKMGLPLPENFPVVNGYQIEFSREEIWNAYNFSLPIFFVNVLDGLDSQYNEWFKKGYVKTALPEDRFFYKSMYREFERIFQAKTGIKVPAPRLTGKEGEPPTYEIADVVMKAREEAAQAKISKRGEREEKKRDKSVLALAAQAAAGKAAPRCSLVHSH